MPRTVQSTLDDPSFQSQPGDVQKSILTKLGVSEDMTGRLLDRIRSKRDASALPAGYGYQVKSPAPGGKTVPLSPSTAPFSVSRPTPPGQLNPDFGERALDRAVGQVEPIFHLLTSNAKITRDYQEGITTPAAKKEAEAEVEEYKRSLAHMAGTDHPTIPGKVWGAGTMGFRMVGQVPVMVQDWMKDPANLAGDVLAAYALSGGKLLPEKITGATGAGTGGTRVPVPPELVNVPRPAPVRVQLTPAQQAEYTASLDAANADYLAAAKKYYQDMTNTFDVAKRDHMEAVQEHDDAVAAASAKYDKAQADWMEKSRKHYNARAESDLVEQQRQTLTTTARSRLTEAFENIHATYTRARASLAQRWNDWRGAMEGVISQQDPAELYNKIEEIRSTRLHNSPPSVREFNNLMKELGIENFVENEDGTMTATPGSEHQSVASLRDHYSAIADRLASGGGPLERKLPGNVYHALQDVQDAVQEQILEAARERGESMGLGDRLARDYQSVQAEEAQFRKDWMSPRSPLGMAIRALDPDLLSARLLGKANNYIARQLAGYQQYGANPTLVTDALQFAQDARNLPTVKIPPAPGPAPEMPSALVSPVEEGGGPGARRSTLIPEKKTPGPAPELAVVTPPEPGPVQVPWYVRATGRITGKIAGTWLAGFKGYIAGGEAGQYLSEYWYKSRQAAQQAAQMEAQKAAAAQAASQVPPGMRMPPGTPGTSPSMPTPTPTPTPTVEDFTGQWTGPVASPPPTMPPSIWDAPSQYGPPRPDWHGEVPPESQGFDFSPPEDIGKRIRSETERRMGPKPRDKE